MILFLMVQYLGETDADGKIEIMMKLIDADALRQDVLALPNCYNGYSDTYDKSLIIGLIDEQIAVDAVPVVRCKDCRYFKTGENERESWSICVRKIVYPYVDVEPSNYCSYGERREDGVDC